MNMDSPATIFTPCTAEEARALTDRIKRAAHDFEQLVWEAHQRRAWKVLGFGSWNDYVRAEFTVSRSYGYRLIQFVEVKATIADSEVSPIGDTPLPERESQVRPLSTLPPEDQPAAWAEAVERAEGQQPPARVVEEVVRERKADRLPEYAPSSGLQFATMAIAQLERIHAKDTQRCEAFSKVITWINKQQK